MIWCSLAAAAQPSDWLSLGWTAEGDATIPGLGSPIAVGDFDGDGFADLAVGSVPWVLGPSSVQVFRGTGATFEATPRWTLSSASDDLLGFAFAAGDVNGDGLDDLVVGAPLAGTEESPNAGRVDLFLGAPDGPSATPAWSFSAPIADHYLGNSVAVADFDGDEFADLALGASYLEGLVYWFRGGPAGPAAEPGATYAWPLDGFRVYASLTGAGDVNADGYGDLIIAAPVYSVTAESGVLLHLGGPFGPDPEPAWRAAVKGWSAIGQAVSAAGDVDGDGFDDVLVAREHVGVALFRGGPSGPETLPTWIGTGSPLAGKEVVNHAAPAGDVNGDGFDDVLVSASGGYAPGTVALYLGSREGLTESPVWTARGDPDEVLLGAALAAAGDVNGDGLDDVVVASPPRVGVYLGACDRAGDADADVDGVPDGCDLDPEGVPTTESGDTATQPPTGSDDTGVPSVRPGCGCGHDPALPHAWVAAALALGGWVRRRTPASGR